MNDLHLTTVLIAGLVINAIDVAATLLFAAKPWNRVLQSQGIAPSALTPPFYITANFVGAAILVQLVRLIVGQGFTPVDAALIASLALWFVTRLYGAGHVVMRQMPLRLFAIMSTGLCGGYVCAGQYIAWTYGPV